MVDVKQLVRFLFVGTITTALYFGVLLVAVEIAHVPVIIASSIACIIAILFNYVCHYRWTFRSTAPHRRVLTRYALMNVGSFVLNAGVMAFGTEVLKWHYLIVQFFAMGMLVAWTMTASALWVYRH